MKRFSLIFLTMALLGFTQCGKDPIDNNGQGDEKSRIVPVRFELQVDNNYRTDFSDFLTNDNTQAAVINWNKTGYETVYLGLPDIYTYDPIEEDYVVTTQCAQLIPLRAECNGASKLVFSGSVENKYLINSHAYTLYYFGNEDSGNIIKSYDDKGKLTEITLDLSEQDGTRGNLGDFHFATLSVKAVANKGADNKTASYTLVSETVSNFTSGIAISYLNLEGVDKLSGSAVSNNALKVKYNNVDMSYDMTYTTLGTEGIFLDNATDKSFIVMVPNEQSGVTLECSKGRYVYENGVEINNIYYNYNTSLHKIEPLKWITE